MLELPGQLHPLVKSHVGNAPRGVGTTGTPWDTTGTPQGLMSLVSLLSQWGLGFVWALHTTWDTICQGCRHANGWLAGWVWWTHPSAPFSGWCFQGVKLAKVGGRDWLGTPGTRGWDTTHTTRALVSQHALEHK